MRLCEDVSLITPWVEAIKQHLKTEVNPLFQDILWGHLGVLASREMPCSLIPASSH